MPEDLLKEQEDGTVIIEETPSTTAVPNAADEIESNDTQAEPAEEALASDDDVAEESSEEREQIREKRREERHLKRELKKQREVSAKHKIASLERRNEELAMRLAAVETSAAGFRVSQLDRHVEDQQLRIDYTKRQLEEAVKNGDTVRQVELMDELTDAKAKFREIDQIRKQQLKDIQKPKQAVPTPAQSDAAKLARAWGQKNTWYDPAGRDIDSRIAQVVDNTLTEEGWDPADPEYWAEFDNRLEERLPHRYGVKPRRGPTSTREARETPPTQKSGYVLSRARVEAIKEAGAWDDPALRQRFIDSYKKYDKTQQNA